MKHHTSALGFEKTWFKGTFGSYSNEGTYGVSLNRSFRKIVDERPAYFDRDNWGFDLMDFNEDTQTVTVVLYYGNTQRDKSCSVTGPIIRCPGGGNCIIDCEI